MFGGISAMPSLHVATAVLFALTAWRIHWVLGVLFWFYALVIQMGSVHLGWHYAVDGYVGATVALVIWWGVARVGEPKRTPDRRAAVLARRPGST